MRTYCIVNGDDFGFSRGINRGILEAHHHGVLTSTSLMVDFPAAGEASRLPGEAPSLGVGLHVVMTHEDCRPRFDFDSRDFAEREIQRQWDRFVDLLGRPPSHLDAHHNVFRDPRLLPVFKELAGEQRVPLREHSGVTYFSEFYGRWDDETHPGQIGVESLCEMLRTRIGAGVTELGCHPGYPGDFKSSYAGEREIELRTLCSPVIRSLIDDLGIRLINYNDLEEVKSAMEGGMLA